MTTKNRQRKQFDNGNNPPRPANENAFLISKNADVLVDSRSRNSSGATVTMTRPAGRRPVLRCAALGACPTDHEGGHGQHSAEAIRTAIPPLQGEEHLVRHCVRIARFCRTGKLTGSRANRRRAGVPLPERGGPCMLVRL